MDLKKGHLDWIGFENEIKKDYLGFNFKIDLPPFLPLLFILPLSKIYMFVNTASDSCVYLMLTLDLLSFVCVMKLIIFVLSFEVMQERVYEFLDLIFGIFTN